MVRIVSGSAQDDPNAALLQGMQAGSAYRQARASRAAEENARAMREAQMQTIQIQMGKLQLAREKFLQEQAGEGSIEALRELALEAKKKPSDGMADAAEIMLHNMPEKFRKEAFGIVKQVLTLQQEGEYREEAEQKIQDLLQSGVLDEAGAMQFQSELAAGGSAAQAVKDLGGMMEVAAKDQAAMEENQLAMQGVMAQIEAAPWSSEREEARAMAKEYEMSPSNQKKKGFGAEQARSIEAKLIGGRESRVKRHQARQKNREGLEANLKNLEATGGEASQPAIAGIKRQLGIGVYGTDEPLPGAPRFRAQEPAQEEAALAPPTAGMKRHISGQAAEKEKRYPGSTQAFRERGGLRAQAVKGGEVPEASRRAIGRGPMQRGSQAVRRATGTAKGGGGSQPLMRAKSVEELLGGLQAQGVELNPDTVTKAIQAWRRGG